MIRHISIFQYQPDCTEAQRMAFEKELTALGKMLSVAHYEIKRTIFPAPEGIVAIEHAPLFGDVAQIIDFSDQDAALIYPQHPGHISLIKHSAEFLASVTTIDYDMNESY